MSVRIGNGSREKGTNAVSQRALSIHLNFVAEGEKAKKMYRI
jgi:hypothetical protein